jgi:hypothetical protein
VNHLFAIWPGNLISLSEPNATLLAAAAASFEWAAWFNSNSMSYVFSGAARVGIPPSVFLPQWHKLLAVREIQCTCSCLVALTGLKAMD